MDAIDRSIQRVIQSLQDRFGRIPTEKEVLDFIYGDDEKRKNIWNSENRT